MALDPRMILGGAQQALARDAGQAGLRGVETGAALQTNLLQQQAAQQALPLQRQLLEQQVQAGQLGLEQGRLNLEQRIQAGQMGLEDAARAQEKQAQADYINSLKIATDVIKPFIEKGDILGAVTSVESLRGIMPDEHIEAVQAELDQGDMTSIHQKIAAIDSFSRAASGDGDIIKGSQRIVNIDDQQFSEVDVAMPDGSLTTIRTPVGGTIVRKTTGETVAEQRAAEVSQTEDKEAAKLSAQLRLKPEVEAEVHRAVAKAKADIKLIGEARSNQTALTVYDTAMTGLTEALGGTVTGPVAGWLPAVTSDQQIAEGAIAAMAPVLKQLFRGAGEGSFTDKDQELLLAMVPTRKDSPEARVSKMKNIDAIVRAKLGQPAPAVQQTTRQPAQQTAAQPRRIRFDNQGNIIQ